MRSIYFGTFGAERYWEEPGLARLPRPGAAFGSGLGALDEVMAPLCEPDDVLCTRYEIPPALLDYHRSVGLSYQARSCQHTDPSEPICRLLLRGADHEWLRGEAARGSRLKPYAVLPSTHSLLAKLANSARLPDVATIQALNSKVWSHALRADLGHPLGVIARSAGGVERAARALLGLGPVILKEPHGVSGAGSMIVESGDRIDRVVRYLSREEESGRPTLLVLEPLLRKSFDFSAQIFVRPDGGWEWVALQGMRNRGGVFQASHPLTDEQESLLERWGYVGFAGRVAAALAAEGYFGPAGIDGMVLADGSVVPLLEINARMTMGLINHHLDRWLQGALRRSYLTSIRPRQPESQPFEVLFEEVRRAGLLFDPDDRPDGVVPLTANTIRESGRWYVCIPYRVADEVPGRLAALERLVSARR